MRSSKALVRALLCAVMMTVWATTAHAAIAISELTSGATGADASSFNTASVTPASGAAVLVIVQNSDGVPLAPSSITGSSISDGSCTVSVSFASTHRLTICRALSTGAAGAITIDWAGNSQSNCGWKVLQITGADVSSSGSSLFVQNSSGADTTGSTAAEAGTLSAFASGSAVVAAFGSNTATNTFAVEGAGSWVESGAEQALTSPTETLGVEWNLSSDTTPTATWGTSTNHRGLAVEIKAASAGSVRCCGGGMTGIIQ